MIRRLVPGVWAFTRLDWMMAWRHLRVGEQLPRWVPALLGLGGYLALVGAGFAWHASTLGDPATVGFDPFGIDSEMGPTQLQRWYGVAGGLTLLVAVMVLLFGALSAAFNLLATIITSSVLLGCMALVVVLSLMSGLEADLRDKILDQHAHIRIARRDLRPFRDFTAVADAVAGVPGVRGASPYLEGEIMVRSGLNRQAAMLIGIVPERHTTISKLGELVQDGSYSSLTHPETIPDADPFALPDDAPWRLRHLVPKEELHDRLGEDPVAELGEAPHATGSRGAGPDLPGTPSLPPSGGSDPPSAGEDAGLPGVVEPVPPPPSFVPKGWEDPAAALREAGKPTPTAGASLPEPGAAPEVAARTSQGVADPVLIGRELAMELAIGLGSQVQLITPVGRLTPAGRVPGAMAAKVGGVFYSGMYEYDRKNVYVPLSTAQAFLRAAGGVTGIEVRLADVDDIDAGRAAVEAAVAASGGGAELIVEDWRDLNRSLFSAMFLEKVAMFIALLFVVLVASFGILASNLMSVMEKAKEIAILKTIGATDDRILRVFTAEGLCVGVLGSLGGIALGLGLCWALDRFGLPLDESVAYIQKLPVVVSPAEVALIGASSLCIVWVSSLYPARVASRMRPVDALRQSER